MELTTERGRRLIVLLSNSGIHSSVVWRPFGENDATQSHKLTNQYHKRNDKDIGPHRETSPSERSKPK
jgi:hypothetical protein